MGKNFTQISIKRVTAFSFFLFLLVIFLMSFRFLESKARDSKRIADLKIIEQALDIYYDQHHNYPANTDDDWAGWDSTYEPVGEKQLFIPRLLTEGILDKIPRDPLNNSAYYYRYRKFEPGSYGCEKAFYILQVINFENNVTRHGSGSCPEKNWADELVNGYTIQNFE